ncbi:hypothetical protein [Romboutsia weinsteinii]|uniref:hypothetical protein n=1 Tax=Romboutsia weinsteinii TaxID=2020949 RepID=UPI001314A16E|nr:hypothetical protein [Romboutsia weinsteinii]
MDKVKLKRGVNYIAIELLKMIAIVLVTLFIILPLMFKVGDWFFMKYFGYSLM